MNRFQRRGQAAAGRRSGGEPPRMTVNLHQEPNSTTPEHMAVLLALLTKASELGRSIPKVSMPVHVSVEFAGQKLCGEIRPYDPETDRDLPAHSSSFKVDPSGGATH